MNHKIVLASTSPRRKDLLESVGIQFEIIAPSSDESLLSKENPEEYALRLSREKALSVSQNLDENTLVIGADTIVVVDNKILSKPKDEQDAKIMLSNISGRAHHVLTAFSITKGEDEILHTHIVGTEVIVKTLEPQEIEGYIKTQEPMDKAGAYGIQGVGAFMVKEVRGSYTNVVGLPLLEVLEALKKLGALELFSGDGFRK
ncbi:MAG: Maf-like protein [Thermodesulfobacteriota bacterium]|nr:MAG: Maf-like protein [Thermodesulfobacteriota bacterium]